MSIDDLDAQTQKTLRRLAERHGWTIEQLAEILLQVSRAKSGGDPILGMMADEPQLMDAVVQSAYEAREHPLRQPES